MVLLTLHLSLESFIACVNIYNDAYCHLHIRNCWVQSYAPKLIKNCRKTCLCGCCSAIPATTSPSATITTVTTTATTTTTTTDTSTKLGTFPQTTTYRTVHRRTTDVTAMTSLGTHSPSHSGGNLFELMKFIRFCTNNCERLINWKE